MTYQLERAAIEAYVVAAWGNATPIGFDGQTFEPVADSIRLTIQSGAVLQGSIGRTANRLDHIGTLIVSVYTAGGQGSQAARGYVETLFGLLRDKRLTSAGALATGNDDVFLRFSPPQIAPDHHPYVSASFDDPPFRITNLTAPFVRYSLS